MLRDTNPKHWKLGVFYYNPAHPRLFVAKRFGVGVTPNLATPVGVALAAMFLVIPTVGFFLVKLHFIL